MGTDSTFHVVMYPWFAFGHLTPFLHLSNKLAERGHRISFLLPTKARAKLEAFNLHPDLIRFVPLVVPHVDGLPAGAETTNDVPLHLQPLIMSAMDRTQPDVEAALKDLKPDFIFFDFTHCIPPLARRLGIKSIQYCITSAATIAYLLAPASIKLEEGAQLSEDDLMHQPPGFPPSSSIKLHRHEARKMTFITYREYGSGVSFHERITWALRDSDAVCFRSCSEIEGPFCEYLEKQYGKIVLLSGPILPEPPTSSLEDRWAKWLDGFKAGSVVYCAFGSECFLEKDQFQELVLGFELTGLPFFVALKPPIGTETMEEALPEGFTERVRGRGVVEGGWVQQQLILGHPSIGCFVSHSGWASLIESLVNQPQLVLLPYSGDQFVHARLMSGDLKVGVEVERREEDGWFTRENVCKAVKMVMDEDNEVGREVRANRLRLRDVFLKQGFDSSYIDGFIEKLRTLIKQ
ncbi:PREDICTED: anthocyanidin 3-O-glucoside 2''-O-glucosyltransferase-like [Nelumbo nucifera]|uniref:Glycosyltransferase n=2 Tax=Nelumbo nucifera TaxID=4432 RepID=A0A1U8B9D4_NELNU|nr:PREDICTED: anthocyanidin 3-O-glucoside 2''-O-glucosyltransferase-like [Nelumbo nucifera]DAD24832.1 TPA_asm: hypothetical protein HUJ06_026296 [Nelumbo nucifera]